jgi:hypothetical protein
VSLCCIVFILGLAVLAAFSETYLLGSLAHIFNRLADLSLQGKKLMAQIDDLNTAIATLTTDLASLSSDVSTCLADLKAQASSPAPDLSGPISSLTALDTSLKTLTATVTSADPGSQSSPGAPVVVAPDPPAS